MKRVSAGIAASVLHAVAALAIPGAVAGAGGADPPASAPADEFDLHTPSPPEISPLDQVFLTKLVRRTLDALLRNEPAYETPYVPLTLENLRTRAAVTLRRNGRLLGTADSGELPIVTACQMAAEKALFAARRENELSVEDLKEIRIEIEIPGPRVPVGDGRIDTMLLAMRFQPALDGIAARVEEREILVRPSQLISMETFCVDDIELNHHCNRYQIALDNLHRRLGLAQDPPLHPHERVIFSRFRTTHWVETEPGGEPIELVAGMILIPPEAITRSELLTIADDLARYIRYRQNRDGLFSYEFLPGRDMYWPDQNWVRQAATAWALAHHATARGDSDSAAALERALEAFIAMLRPVQGVDRAVYMSTPDRREPLGATALLCLAMLDSPRPERYDEHIAGLVTAMSSLQREDGSFRTCFLPCSTQSSQDYFPGEALLAIARYYATARDGALRALCDRSLPFYQRYFRQYQPPMFIPWQVQAWGCLARATQLRKYADFVFEMADTLLPLQIEGRTGGEAIYNGAFDVHRTGRAGISTAVYVEGLVEAVRTADAFKEHDRAQRYREAIRKAARFIVQLRFRPEECFYVQSPHDVVGGMRDTPADPTLRIDHAQHALSALLGAANVALASPGE